MHYQRDVLLREVEEPVTSVDPQWNPQDAVVKQVPVQPKADLREFDKLVDMLESKKNELKAGGHDLVANDLVTMLYNINYSKNQYLSNQISLEVFKFNVQGYIKQNRDELDQHRGCKELLVNLLAAVCSLFVPYLIAAAIKGDLMLFHPATDSGDKLDKLNKSVETLSEGPAV